MCVVPWGWNAVVVEQALYPNPFFLLLFFRSVPNLEVGLHRTILQHFARSSLYLFFHFLFSLIPISPGSSQVVDGAWSLPVRVCQFVHMH